MANRSKTTIKTYFGYLFRNRLRGSAGATVALLTVTGMLTSAIVRADDSFAMQLVNAAIARTTVKIRYDDSYFYIDYPFGDVPPNLGVCSDVVVRSYRALNIDLQQLVHEDMTSNFHLYPSTRIWGLTEPDTNIDHRRVPNLRVFFSRYGKELPITNDPDDYAPGDLVTWRMRGNRPHIGIITDLVAPSDGTPLIVHNIGRGPVLDNILFDYPISGHYAYDPSMQKQQTTKTASARDDVDPSKLFIRKGNKYVLDEELLKQLFPEQTDSKARNQPRR